MEEFIFVVDTEQYTGNFEREITAYMTGRIGDCEVGNDQAELFYEEMGLVEEGHKWGSYEITDYEDLNNPFDFVISKPDEHGCNRPTMIWQTPGWFNHGMGGAFRDGQEDEAIEDFRRCCIKYGEKKPYHNNKKANKGHLERWKATSEEPLNKCPAYLSVAIFMAREPNESEITILVDRAIKYATKNKITITNFRLLVETTTLKDIEEEAIKKIMDRSKNDKTDK